MLLALVAKTFTAQNRNIDSLKNALAHLPDQKHQKAEDTLRIDLLNRLSVAFLSIGNYDSMLHYAGQSLQLAKTSGDHPGVKRGMAGAYNNIGLARYNLGNYPEALKNQYAALKIQEKINHRSGLANSYNNIGLVHHSQGLLEDALRDHEAALKIRKALNDVKGNIASHMNIGNVYLDLDNPERAFENYQSALMFAQKAGDRLKTGNCYGSIGITYLRRQKYDEAKNNLMKALEIGKSVGDKFGELVVYGNLSSMYYELKDYQKAKTYAEKMLDLAREIRAPDMIRNANYYMHDASKGLGKYADALKYYEAFVIINDSLLSESNTRKSIETQIQFNFDKKAAADSVKVSEEKKVVAVQLKHEKTQRFGLYGGLILTLLFAGFVFNRFRVTMRQKNIIAAKEQHAQKQTQIIARQKDLVEDKQKEILDSITYARRIQQALLASKQLLDSNLVRNPSPAQGTPDDKPGNSGGEKRDYFILFRPRDIVSGDFYWASLLPNGEFALVIGDSTGHGVPGAIMSILNISCLNEVISKNEVRPDRILFETRKRVIDYLKNDGSGDGGKDGMDCTLLSFNFRTNVLSYSGANNPLWIVRDGELIEIKPDKMPVGKHAWDQTDFTLHSFPFRSGDRIYTCTDGYADQFGGQQGKKFMSRKFKNLLLSISSRPAAEQRQLLSETFDAWKANIEQVDDVTVFGLCID